LGIGKKIVISGQSMGGYIAIHFAHQFPERVKGLILLNTMANLLDSEEAKSQWDGLIQSLKKDREATMRQVIAQMFYGPFDPSIIDRQIEMTMKTPLDIGIKAFNEILTKNLLSELKGIKIPALIIHGDHDLIPLRHAEAMHQGLTNSRLVVLKDCGHLSFVEKPVETQKVIFDFLESL